MYVFPKKKPEAVTTIECHLRVKTMALLSKKEKKKEQENSHLDPQASKTLGRYSRSQNQMFFIRC